MAGAPLAQLDVMGIHVVCQGSGFRVGGDIGRKLIYLFHIVRSLFQIALDIFNDIAKMIDDAVVTVYVDNKPVCHNEKDSLPVVQKRTVKRGRFKFSMVGIKIGECVTFMPTNTEVKVASDDSVEYQGRIYKLSPFVGTFMPEEKRNTSGAYQGAKYFSYKGKVLDDLRSIIESNIPLPESDVIQNNIEQ